MLVYKVFVLKRLVYFYCYLLVIQCYSHTQKRDYNHCYINYTDIVINRQLRINLIQVHFLHF